MPHIGLSYILVVYANDSGLMQLRDTGLNLDTKTQLTVRRLIMASPNGRPPNSGPKQAGLGRILQSWMLATKGLRSLSRCYYNMIDHLVQYKVSRWIFTLALCLFYFERSYGMSYYIVTYLIGFYLLQLAVNYVTPKGLEDADDELEDFQPYLSDSRQDEDRPLAPSMSEIQIWERITYAFAMGTVCTCFKLLEIDVFWPMLVVYFLLLACYTVRKVIRQMLRHNYGLGDFVKG